MIDVARHDLVVIVGHHGGLALALQRLALAVELDEIDRRIRARAIGHAVAHAGADEGQVRIAVARLDDLLLVGQLAAQVHLIVAVFAALREQRVERAEELRHQVVLVVAAAPTGSDRDSRPWCGTRCRARGGGGAAGRRLLGDAAVDVDGLEAALRRQRQRQFRRAGPNHA